MNTFRQHWHTALPRLQALLDDFGTRLQPISMATSAETGAFLHALLAALPALPTLETGSGFSSAVLVGAVHVEDNPAYQQQVQRWLADRRVPPGRFIGYDELHTLQPEGPFFMFLDGNLSTRERSADWLDRHLAQAVLVIDDAQAGTFAQVRAVLERLQADPRGRLLDCAAWTRDGYGRTAALWVGQDSGFPPELLEQIEGGPGLAAPELPPVLLMLCVHDTPQNQRWLCTARTLTSLGITARLQQHGLWIVDNGSTCAHSAALLREWCGDQWRQGARLRVFRLPENRHATYAYNRLLAMAPAQAVVVRVENDIEFHTFDWPAVMQRFLAHSGYGLVSALPVDLPAKAAGVAASWLAGFRVRVVTEVPGYCTAFAPALRRQLGALVCAGQYIEDVLTSERCQAAGFGMAFLEAGELRCFHVDRGTSAGYTAWKQQAAAAEWAAMLQVRADWREGRRLLHEPWSADASDGFSEWPQPPR